VTTSLTTDAHLDVVAARVDVMASVAARTDPGTVVPTCPQWVLRDLVVHQGGVHRWATAHVVGAADIDSAPMFVAPEGADQLAAWLRRGADELLTALRSAPDDLNAVRFLKDAPAPRAFWARRQAHEMTIHSVDAQSAELGRTIAAHESGIAHEVAVDGLDELVAGFVPRGTTRLRHHEPVRISIAPTDSDVGYTVDVSSEPPFTRSGIDTDADLTVRGTARQLYLGLWNRGDEIDVSGRTELLDAWRRQMRIRWS